MARQDPVANGEPGLGSERKLFAAAGIFLLVLLVALGVVASTVLLRSFARLEEEHTRADVLRVAGALLADLAALESSTTDWAFWDDAYEFVKKPNPAFEKANLNFESFDNLKVNGMVFLDVAGRLVRSTSYDLEKKTAASWKVETYLPQRLVFPPGAGERDARSGVLLTPEQVMFVAARPILTSKREGPSVGTLVMCRWLTLPVLERLSAITRLKIMIRRLDDREMAPEVKEIAASLSEATPAAARVVDASTIEGYALLSDIAGRPALLVEANSPRSIYQAGRRAVGYMLAGVGGVGLLFGLVALALVRRLAASQSALRHRVNLEKLIAAISARFVRVTAQEMDAATHASLREIGVFAGADRCYLYQLTSNGAIADNTHEWCAEGIESQKEKAQGLRREDYAWWAARLKEREAIIVPSLSHLPPEAAAQKAMMQAQGVRSAILVPLIARDRVAGFLGFVSIRRERTWTKDDLLLLQMVSEILFNALERRRAEEDLVEANRRLEAALKELRATQEQVVQQERRRSEEDLVEVNRRLEAALKELRATQEQVVQQERLRALGQMASGVAHDFNNALVPILGYADLLLTVPGRLDDQAEARRMLQVICTAARDAANVVSRLGEFHRRRGDGESRRAVELGQVVLDAMRLSQPRWKDQALADGKTIEFDLQMHDKQWVLGDASELRQMLLNLILNAVDAMPEGGTITMQTRREGDHVVLAVSDTGVGMSEDVARRCFDPFFTTKAERGSGLGLAAVYGIVQRHEGAVRVESAPGKGSTFIIRLPACEQPPPSSASSEPPDARPAARPLRILVVDDDQAVRGVLMLFVAADGHTAVAAANGNEALENLRTASYDLILVDRAMPGMNGIELATAIKRQIPGQRIIMISGFGDLMHSLGEEVPCVDLLLSKPIRHEDLTRAIAAVTGR